MRDKLNNLKNEAIAMAIGAEGAAELERLRVQYLGKSGALAQIAKQLSGLPSEEKKDLGQLFNDVKSAILQALESKSQTDNPQLTTNNYDLSLPGTPAPAGILHPITVVTRELNGIFQSLGFSVADGPELENDEYNYNRLNLPADHPARDLQDTLYIKEPDVILRTHTSSVEAHILAETKPPYRFVIPGKVYRYENLSVANNAMFFQYQGLAVGEGITMANLKSTINTFIRLFYGPNRKSRFRCKYYPEVEPGVGVDIDCPFCAQKGCAVCKQRGWIEMLGAGMVHPNMLRQVNLNPATISGFAWGMGLDRIVMTRYGINDIRSLTNGDLLYNI